MEKMLFEGGIADESTLLVKETRFRNFIALQSKPGPKTLFLDVFGEILVGNPGIDVELSYAIPQGINPKILLLRADLVQKPGNWIQVMTWKPARYTTMLREYDQYTEVQVDAQFGSVTTKVEDRIVLPEPAGSLA